ncbi:hypothetical protein L6R50_20215 [Myxococcota bacterium]|nr:hypothetical protein [Myxococcota bacterium]
MSEPLELTRADIRRLLVLLDEELAGAGVRGELYLVGGAVMCLLFNARPSTRDVDAWFRPSSELREAASRVALRAGVPDDWLNDGVKGFLSPRGDFDPYLELGHLRVFTACPEYLFALKCAAMRLGKGFRDEADVRYLLRALNIERFADAQEIVLRYFDEDRLPQKTWYALEELLGGAESGRRQARGELRGDGAEEGDERSR